MTTAKPSSVCWGSSCWAFRAKLERPSNSTGGRDASMFAEGKLGKRRRSRRDVELGGIEPPSAVGVALTLRPFPWVWLAVATSPGRVSRSSPPDLFSDVSGLSRRQRSFPAVHHCFCCRAAVIWPREPLPVPMTLCYLTRSGGESDTLVAVSLVAPFKESEQLRSHDALLDPQRRNRSAPCQSAYRPRPVSQG